MSSNLICPLSASMFFNSSDNSSEQVLSSTFVKSVVEYGIVSSHDCGISSILLIRFVCSCAKCILSFASLCAEFWAMSLASSLFFAKMHMSIETFDTKRGINFSCIVLDSLLYHFLVAGMIL